MRTVLCVFVLAGCAVVCRAETAADAPTIDITTFELKDGTQLLAAKYSSLGAGDGPKLYTITCVDGKKVGVPETDVKTIKPAKLRVSELPESARAGLAAETQRQTQASTAKVSGEQAQGLLRDRSAAYEALRAAERELGEKKSSYEQCMQVKRALDQSLAQAKFELQNADTDFRDGQAQAPPNTKEMRNATARKEDWTKRLEELQKEQPEIEASATQAAAALHAAEPAVNAAREAWQKIDADYKQKTGAKQ